MLLSADGEQGWEDTYVHATVWHGLCCLPWQHFAFPLEHVACFDVWDKMMDHMDPEMSQPQDPPRPLDHV